MMISPGFCNSCCCDTLVTVQRLYENVGAGINKFIWLEAIAATHCLV